MKNGRRVSAKTVAKRGQDGPGARTVRVKRMPCIEKRPSRVVSRCVLLYTEATSEGKIIIVGNASKEIEMEVSRCSMLLKTGRN